MSNIHDGHKQRLRDKAKLNMDVLSDHEVLELLLNYTVVRSNMNPVAHRLIDKFGSLSAVLNAEEEYLLEVDGVGKATASFLSLLPSIINRYNLSSAKQIRSSDWNTDTCVDYFARVYASSVSEELYIVFLDDRDKFIALENVAHGDLDSVGIDCKEIARKAIKHRAKRLILVHNHLSGCAIPSNADKQSTIALVRHLLMVGIAVIEHVIMTSDNYYSFRDYCPECLTPEF